MTSPRRGGCLTRDLHQDTGLLNVGPGELHYTFRTDSLLDCPLSPSSTCS